MRLLNVSTFELEEFYGEDTPKYAILSHTWGREEITMSEMETISKHRRNQSQQLANQQEHQHQLMARTSGSLEKAEVVRMMLLTSMLATLRTGGSYPFNYSSMRSRSITNGHDEGEEEQGQRYMPVAPVLTSTPHPLESKAGYSKIVSACKQAAADGHRYLWADTCCIDKTNGYEISEAINSMFSWYQNAAVCYAHLEDVIFGEYKSGYRTWEHDFLKSRYFTRGWTLQELIAPRRVVFFAKGWQWLGTKSDAHLSKHIEKITKIEPKVLADPLQIPKTCIARRMAWASQRKTTRPEDTAYSLLGIFSVNLPLLYGEGAESAFSRLQEEIIKSSDDHTLFAWGLVTQPPNTAAIPTHYDSLDEFDHDEMVGMTGILARSPADFAGMDRVVPATTTMPDGDRSYKLTNKGLKIKLKLAPFNPSGPISTTGPKFYLGVLNCQHSEDDPSSRLGMLLTETETPNVLFRTRTRMYSWISGTALATAIPRQIYICQNNPARMVAMGSGGQRLRDELVWIKARDLVSPGYVIVDIRGKRSHWNREFSTLRVMGIEDRVFYQLAVVTFWNAHMGRGFYVRVLVDGGGGGYFVDLGVPRKKEEGGVGKGDDEMGWLREEAERLWKEPGKIRVVAPAGSSQGPGKGLRGTMMEDIANPDVYGTEEQPAWKSRAAEEGWEAVGGDEFQPSVAFSEAWEKEYMRTVRATVERRKDVIVLEISSMLWEAGPAADVSSGGAGEVISTGMAGVSVEGGKDVAVGA